MRISKRRMALLAAVSFALWFCGVPSSHAQKPAKKRAVKVVSPTRESTPRLGTYYALVVGIKNYQNFTPLETPLNDAKEIATILREQYGFKTQLLFDATRDQILDALGHYRGEIHENDNLLIYYAGHGFFDKSSDLAYWYPVEAGKASTARWINASEITGEARAIPARHVLVIADSCYSGMIARGAEPTIGVPQERDQYLRRLIERKSRHVMSSGGNEPVADRDTPGHSPDHSVFANALLRGLREFQADEYSAEELFNQYVRVQVAGRSAQLPEYNAIKNSEHDEGGFVFSRLHGLPPPPIENVIIPATKIDLIKTAPDPPRHRITPEEEVIRATLRRYEEAYESMDIDMLKAVWPTLSKVQIDGLRAGFSRAQAVKVRVKCDLPTTSGDAARVKCEQSMMYTRDGKRQPAEAQQVEISLQKAAGGGWVVADVRAR